jgi:hypothetical protein
MSVLDVFKDDAFGVISLTDSINQIPFVPGRASSVIDWNEQGVATTTIFFEQRANTLQMVNPSPRGGVGETREKFKRSADVLAIPHYEINDGINADEVQGVRAFGQESQVQVVQDIVGQRLAQFATDLDVTLEFQRLGAVKGIILNADLTTLYNLFTKFNVTPQTEVDFNLTSTADDGALITACTQVQRTIARALGGMTYSGVHGFVSDEFWDALMANTERRKTYQAQNAAQLRDNVAGWGTYAYGGIVFENYRGGVGVEEATQFIEPNKAYFFPTGVPRLFRTVYAPADYMETVNTIGLPRYAKQFPWPNDKGVALETQMNALSYCTRPRALVKGKTT